MAKKRRGVPMKIQTALNDFIKAQAVVEKTLDALREEVKLQATRKIHAHMIEEDFESSNQVIKQLESFTRYSFLSNGEEITQLAKQIIGEGGYEELSNHSFLKKETSIKPFHSFKEDVDKNNDNLISIEEEQAIEFIGNNGDERKWNKRNNTFYHHVKTLEDKGYIQSYPVHLYESVFSLYSLTKSGKEVYEKRCGVSSGLSLIEELESQHTSIEKGLFLFDVENEFQKRNYIIEDSKLTHLEISKGKEHFYLTLVSKSHAESYYANALNKKNQLKNIGFIFAKQEELEKAKRYTEAWTEQNRTKCRFLTIHFATLEDVSENPDIFSSIDFKDYKTSIQ